MWVWLTGGTQNELLCYLERERPKEAEATVLQGPVAR